MSNKEKLPKLLDVYRSSKRSKPLGKRQLPLIVDDKLTLVMDLKELDIMCDNPLEMVTGKHLEDFMKKWETLTVKELRSALQITKSELMNVLNQNVPCVGCRRGVERLHHQLYNEGHNTLDPLMVKSDGTITIKEEPQQKPQLLCSIFYNHSTRLSSLIENQPKRSKKSLRCILHSLESQRNRPIIPVWRDIWDCMKPECKKDVCIIEAPDLHTTLETYLRKHRFCGECRTKVLKAYTLLIEDPEPNKEKGYVSSLYAGISRCVPDKHIHLQTKTDYIMKLISRAEPELLGRERHAKTLEIAQEEVLTCVGICMYDRLHRIYMRMREEELSCRVFAAVALNTLNRSFETAMERKKGISHLDMLYAELAREEQQKLVRKEAKKTRRKRKKGKNGADEDEEEGKENNGEEDDDEKDDLGCFACDYASKERCSWLDGGCKCEELDDDKNHKDYNNRNYLATRGDCNGSGGGGGGEDGKTKANEMNNGSSSDHSHDCGYSSENNNGCCGETGSLISSISSSPEGSELACSDTCCQHEAEYLGRGRYGQHRSLQEMLEVTSDDENESNWKLTAEEVYEFENNHKHLVEKRQELREELKKKFIDFCVYGPLLVQTKYASN